MSIRRDGFGRRKPWNEELSASAFERISSMRNNFSEQYATLEAQKPTIFDSDEETYLYIAKLAKIGGIIEGLGLAEDVLNQQQ